MIRYLQKKCNRVGLTALTGRDGISREAIARALDKRREKEQLREDRKREREAARRRRAARKRDRIRIIQDENGRGLELLPKTFPEYFKGFDIEQGFWFALVTGCIIPIFLTAALHQGLEYIVPNSIFRAVLSVVFSFDICAGLYFVSAYFLYPPVRLYITRSNNYALFIRRSNRPKVVGHVRELRIAINDGKLPGLGQVAIGNAGRKRVFLRLKPQDVTNARSFLKKAGVEEW